jgi:hypothetical protein
MVALAAMAAASFAVVPASASATVSVEAPAIDFGSVPVGSASAPKPVGLTSSCMLPAGGLCPGFATDAYYVHVSATGDFAATDNCPNPLGPTLNILSLGCTINVTFTPSGAGPRTGTLNTGTTDITGLVPGPTVALAGAGATGSTGGPRSDSPNVAPRKKCKKKRKHRAAQTAKKKKCKKKRR